MDIGGKPTSRDRTKTKAKYWGFVTKEEEENLYMKPKEQ